MITADMVRAIITGHDAARPRSKQTKVGPSDLSSPCDRKLVYQILGVPKVVDDTVNLAAWVGTGIHAQMEAALKGDPDWLTEQPVAIKATPKLTLSGTLDAYHKPSHTIVDWKSVGPSALAKYRRKSPENYLTQISLYGLAAILSGRMQVEHTAIAYIPRNGNLADIHVDAHPWDEARAEAALRRFENLHAAAAAGPVVLPLLGTADDCRFCSWWQPGSDTPEVACTGHPTTDVHGIPPWQPEKEKETAS